MSTSLARRLGLRSAVLIAGVAALLVSAPAPVHTQGPDIAVVVHPDVPIDNLTTAELRRILLGDREFWTSGVRVALFLRAPVARERDVAIKDVCQMTEAQFRQHWIAKVFRADTPNTPRIVYSGQMAIEQVSRTPGAITFVENSAVVKGVKVLKIDGRSPGQSGYRVR
jgi:ABC-type phosphate transport system substrate-binding protein